jgi:hypothetical protein
MHFIGCFGPHMQGVAETMVNLFPPGFDPLVGMTVAKDFGSVNEMHVEVEWGLV